jgi:hypothetical protein
VKEIVEKLGPMNKMAWENQVALDRKGAGIGPD